MRQRIPRWIKAKLPTTSNYAKVRKNLDNGCLHTICEEASCPNRGECWDVGTATFLILGDTCTRNCKYCNVIHGNPTELDLNEPKKLAESVKKLGLRYAVITSVTRDDLPDGGASHFADVITEIRKLVPECRIEVLIPDFRFEKKSLKTVLDAKPDVLNHNIEVAEEIYGDIRPQGDYKGSLSLLKSVKSVSPEQITKSGLMIGLGENEDSIIKTLSDLKDSDVDIVTIGQYLQPSKKNPEVVRYYTPDEFKALKKIGYSLGFRQVESAPLVRSSYHASETFDET